MDAHALQVRWQKARHYFSSLFRELESHQKAIGDEAYADWCIQELGISVGVLKKTTALLKEVDARIARESLQKAHAAELRKKAQARLAKQAEKERLEAEKAEKARKARKAKSNRKYRQKKKKEEAARCILASAIVQ